MAPSTEQRPARGLDRLSGWILRRAVAAGGSRAHLAAFAVLAAVVSIAARRWDPLVPVAFALVAAVLWGALEAIVGPERGVPRALREITKRLGPPTVIVAVSVAMLWPIWTGRRAAFLDQDNVTHVERARAFWESLSRGRWPGWTHVLEGGEPLADAYGWLGNLLPPLVRLLTLGKISFERAYVWTLCSLHAASALAVYALASRFARRRIALLVSLLFIGGGHLVPAFAGDRPIWHVHLHMGLWHSLLSAVLAVFAAAKLVDVVRRGRSRDVVWVAALACGACLSHGFGSLATLVVAGCTAAAAFLRPDRSWRRPALGVLALVTGMMLAAAWVLPASRVLGEYGLRYQRPPHELDQSLLEFVGPLHSATVLAAGVACFAALFHRDRLLRGVALAALLPILVDESGIVAQLGLADSAAGRGMQWHRLTVLFYLASPAPLAAMLDRMLDGAHAARRREPLAWHTVTARAIGIALVVIFAMPPLVETVRRGRQELVHLQPWTFQDETSYRLLEPALRELRAQDPESAFRVHFGTNTNAHAAMALALRTGIPITAMVSPPGLFLKNRPQSGDLEGVRAWGAKYLVHDGAAVSSNWKPVAKAGAYTIYRDDAFRGLARAPAGVEATITTFRDDEIRMTVRGAPPGGVDVQLGVAHYPRFRAWQDGRRVEVRAAPAVPSGPADQLLVHVVDGEVVIRPDGPLPSWGAGLVATVLGAAMLGLVVARRSPRVAAPLARLGSWVRARRDDLVHRVPGPTPRQLVLVLVGAAVVIAAAASVPRSASPRIGLRPFAFDRGAVSRNGQRCRESLATRRWICGSEGGVTVAEVFHAVSSDPALPPYSWPTGDAWSALRIVEREKPSTIQLRFAQVKVHRWVHLHLAPSGAAPSAIGLHVNDGPPIPVAYVHGFRTVDTGFEGVADLYLDVQLSAGAGLDVALSSDGSSETPSVAKN